MMNLKCVALLVLTVFGAVQSASYYGRNIPVEVRYQNTEHIQPALNEAGENQVRFEKISSNVDQLKAEKLQEAENRVKNEKLSEIQQQLEQEKQKTDLLAAEKLSLESSKLEAAEETGHRIGAQTDQKLLEANKRHSEEITQEIKQDQTQLSADQSNQALRYISEEQQNNPLEAKPTDKLSWLNQAQDYIEKGLEDLKMNFKPANGSLVPKPEFWQKLETEVREYFKGEMNKLNLKQQTGGNQQNFFQNIAHGIQTVTNNLVQGFQSPSNATGQEDDGATQQAPWQGFVGYFQGGVQNLVNTVQNFGQQPSGNGNSTVLGDSGTGNQPPPFFGGIISNVQQFFQGGQNLVGGGNGSQSDSPSNGQNTNFFQGIQQGINQVVNNFNNIIPSTTPGSVQGDEGNSSKPQSGPFQQVFNQIGTIGTAWTQFIQGSQNPQGSEDDSSSGAPQQNFIQSIGQNIGNTFQNIQNQFRPPSIPSIPSTSGNDSSNPISGIAGQIQQVAGQASGSNPLENLVPGSAGSNSSSKQPQDQPKQEETPETNEIREETRAEPIPEEPKKPESSPSPDAQNTSEEPKMEIQTESIREEIPKMALKTVLVETENAVVPEIQHIPAVKKIVPEENIVVIPEVPVVPEVQNNKVVKNLETDENVVVVPAEAAVDENVVPAIKNVDNIEEIIEEIKAQETEDKPIETKKVEAMQATE